MGFISGRRMRLDRVCMCGGAAARELESQEPLPRVLMLRRRESPAAGRLRGHMVEILAGACLFQPRTGDAACAVDIHANRDFDASADRLAGAARNVGYLLMEYSTRFLGRRC